MTTLTATYQAGVAGVAPPRVLLAVAAAPSLAASYASTFVASVDGWTAAGGGTLAFNQGAFAALKLTGTTVQSATSTASKVVTGLTIGQTYAITLMADLDSSFNGYLSVVGIAGSTRLPTVRGPVTRSFTATATSHTITVSVQTGKAPVGGSPPAGVLFLDTVVVKRSTSWLGTTIRRTDANGTSVVVREDLAGQDTVGVSGSATMTVTDYEAALTGAVSYTVTDGAGGTATAGTTAPVAPGVWLALPATAVPSVPTAPSSVAVTAVVDYTEASASTGIVHEVIGRADNPVNPGPLQLRSGRLDIYCTDYATALAVRTLFATGLVAQLRQPDYPAFDRYLVARAVDVTTPEDTIPRRWLAAVTYQEVPAP